MPYSQIKPFNPAKGGSVKYLCLRNVRLGYSILPLYNDAFTAWQNTAQHTDPLPKGVAVPVFWELWLTLDGKYANYGHIGVSLPDGRVWTDGKYYANIDTLNRYYLGGRGKYLGWGETLNNVRVVEEEELKLTRKQVGRLIFTLWGRDAKEDELQVYTQREAGDLVKRLIDDPQTTKQISRLLDQRSTAAKLKDKIISLVKGA